MKVEVAAPPAVKEPLPREKPVVSEQILNFVRNPVEVPIGIRQKLPGWRVVDGRFVGNLTLGAVDLV